MRLTVIPGTDTAVQYSAQPGEAKTKRVPAMTPEAPRGSNAVFRGWAKIFIFAPSDKITPHLRESARRRARSLAGAHAEPKAAKAAPKPGRPRKGKPDSATPSLFGSDPDKETP